MFKDIIIGQYVEGDSPIHKLDARVKILLSMVYIIVLFVINSFTAYAAFVVFTAAVIIISRIPLRYIVRGLKPILYILIFTAIINLFMSGGTAAYAAGNGNVASDTHNDADNADRRNRKNLRAV